MSSVQNFQPSGNYEPGTYCLIRQDGGTFTAGVVCPKCGELTSLRKHVIHEDGRVDESVKCSNGECNFMSRVKLVKWRNTIGSALKTH